MDLGPCPDENALLDFAGGFLDSSELARFDEHIGQCPSCQVILGRWLHSEGSDPEAREAPVTGDRGGVPLDTPELARGAALDRYVLLKPLGAGGMGLVFGAYDPLLDRTVAIKVLRHEVATAMPSSVRVRMLREARAMARLSHPNVVAVHDAGLFHGRVFIAMEYLEGGSLADWLRARPRTWKEIREVFVSAGRGLAAAHGRGLVHRDFKPQNVLFSADGAVKISDFGLVRPSDSAEAAFRGELDPPLFLQAPVSEKPVTATGAVVGTPGYIAPELLRGGAPDGRSDQYSFCAALHLALRGHLPGVTAGHAASISSPDWLGRLVSKGLEANPEARYPSMEALLDELSSRDRRIRRRTFWTTAASLALLASGGAVALGLREPSWCSDRNERLLSAWGPERMAAVKAAFERSSVPVARESWEHVEHALGRYAASWSEQYAAVCQAARSSRSSRAITSTADCLDARLDDLGNLVGVLFSANDLMVREDAARAVGELPAPAACGGEAHLAAESAPPPPAAQGRVRAVRSKLGEAWALYRAGEYARGASIAESVVTEARLTRYPLVLAETLSLEGKLLARLNRLKEAERILKEASLEAERAGKHSLLAEITADVAEVLVREGHFELAEEWVERGEAVLEHAGGHTSARVAILEAHATVHAVTERYDKAVPMLEQALSLTEEVFGPSHPRTAAVLIRLGKEIKGPAGADRARGFVERARQIYERIYGPNHPANIEALRALGQLARDRADYLEELEIARRVLEVKLSGYGPEDIVVAEARWPLGNALANLGDQGAALREFRSALITFQRVYGGSGEADHQIAALQENVGLCQFQVGQDAESRIAMQRGMELHVRARGPDDPKVAQFLSGLGLVAGASGRLGEANVLFERAIALVRSAGEPSGDLQMPYLSAAQVQYEAGHFAQARESYLAALPSVRTGAATGSVEMAVFDADLAAAELAEGQVETALARVSAALGILELAIKADQPLKTRALVVIGEAQRRLGHPDLALPYLERAERLRRTYGARPIERGETFLALAFALRAQGKSPERVQALLREARAEFSKSAWRKVWLPKLEMRQ